MKKKLNIDLIQSELRGGSAVFPGYKGSASPPSLTDEPGTPENARSVPQSKASTPDRPKPASHIEKPEKVSESRVDSQGAPLPVPRTVPRTEPRPDHLTPKVKRPMKQRQPFDIYEDQYVRLKQIADSERSFVNGRGMSQMVREAIDAYLETNTSANKK